METAAAGCRAAAIASWKPTAVAALSRALESSAAVKATTPSSRPGAASCGGSPTCQPLSPAAIRAGGLGRSAQRLPSVAWQQPADGPCALKPPSLNLPLGPEEDAGR